jgi:mono/diheme cytochrome c family protein
VSLSIRNRWVCLFWAGLAAAALVPGAEPASKAVTAARQEFFETKVRPLLSKHCLGCHKDAGMGGLQMDTQENMMKGGEDGPVVVPGKPDQSLLVKAISYTDSRIKMPPTGKLPDDEIAIVETWVRDGAIWGATSNSHANVPAREYVITPEQRAFWSFQPVRKPTVPPVKEGSKVKSPIDAFVLAKLEAKGLRPAPPADKRTLIRRATMDLIGLPSSPSEVQAFVADKSADAFEKVVDRLLASPHYGERWGRYWLDVARYSDYQLTAEGDGPLPNAFQYRDWVVQSFNEDMPYDQFVRAQIAGDQAPESERKKLVGGLGFYALSPKPEFREERVDATTRGFLGLTAACAECHDHKYDPIPTRDYYSLLGVFDSTEPDKFALKPVGVVAQYETQKKALDEQKKVLDKFLENQRTQLSEIFAEKTADYMAASWRVIGPEKERAEDVARGSSRLERDVLDRWVQFLDPERKREYKFLDSWQALVKKGAPEPELRKSAEGFQALIVAALKEQSDLDAENAKIKARAKEGESPKTLPLERNKFYLLKDLSAGQDKKTKRDAGPFFFSADEVGHYLTSVYKEYFDALRARIEKMQSAMPPEYPYYPVIKDKAKPANIHVYIRGNPETPGEESPRQFLAILSPGHQIPFQKGSGRLELAEAIATAANPLTARVMVNRIWQHHFGAGVVDTPSNFGKLGNPPTHPELLDYLASRFVESGWSIKKMHREIMLSATYALSSNYSEVNFQADPDNKLLWRANVRRMDVEAIRDSILFVAGNLDPKVGGPALPLHDEKNTRRTIYAAVSRAKPDALLRLFDFPDPNETSEQRIATNVPVQQLFFLNSDFVRSQAELLAKRIGSPRPEPQGIKEAYLILFGRTPTQQELKYGSAFLSNQNNSWTEYLEVLLSSIEFNYIS